MSDPSPALPPGFQLVAFDTIGSTNDEAKALARRGAPDGTLVWAREQVAGRGRRGRTWVSPPGNLYLSVVSRPGGAPVNAAQLGFVAALGLASALDELVGPRLQLSFKWPNDLLAHGRKLAGILLESETGTSGAVDFVVIGMGVNVASAPTDLEYPATSLRAEGYRDVTPAALLGGVVRHFEQWERRWHDGGFAPIRQAWVARARGIGDAIRVRLEGETLEGRFLDLDEDGALLLVTAGGHRRIAAGEVFPAA